VLRADWVAPNHAPIQVVSFLTSRANGKHVRDFINHHLSIIAECSDEHTAKLRHDPSASHGRPEPKHLRGKLGVSRVAGSADAQHCGHRSFNTALLTRFVAGVIGQLQAGDGFDVSSDV
jgi:hypothetical protein